MSIGRYCRPTWEGIQLFAALLLAEEEQLAEMGPELTERESYGMDGVPGGGDL